MLKKRMIAVVLIRNGIAVQSIGFKQYLPLGKPEIAVDFLNQWGADEIAVVDIDATRNQKINFSQITHLSQKCLVPITYAGGIQTTQDMVRAVQAGADKVMINSSFLNNPQFITDGAKLLGAQCLVVSLDVKKDPQGRDRIYKYMDQTLTPLEPTELALKAQNAGAGEIFLNSVDRDGSKRGFDLPLAEAVSSKLQIPLTICGGANHPDHFALGLRIKNVSAVAAANFFHFTEHSITILKSFLNFRANSGVRLDSYCNYHESGFLDNGRLSRKDDRTLKELIFEYHEREII